MKWQERLFFTYPALLPKYLVSEVRSLNVTTITHMFAYKHGSKPTSFIIIKCHK